MDTMEWTKIVGGLCGSLLVFLLIQWGTESIYHGSDHTDHGEHHASQNLDKHSETPELDESTEIPFIQLVMMAIQLKAKRFLANVNLAINLLMVKMV